VDNTLYFAANDDRIGWELWKSDGSVQGTVLLKDINPGAGYELVYTSMIDVNGIWYAGLPKLVVYTENMRIAQHIAPVCIPGVFSAE
jgi:ELWxxDGT repeat protein